MVRGGVQSFLHGHPLALLCIQAVLVIASSRLLGVLLKKLGQPLVIAEVLAGIALGPSLLGVLSPSTLQLFFPPASMPVLGLVSQLGLVFFMFLIGLELEPSLLRGMGKSELAISNVSIAFPFALGAGAAVLLAPTLNPSHVPLLSFVLFLGVALSITAFPVLARILSERRLTHTPVGSLAITCAAIDDVSAWCLLALISAVVRASGLGGVGLTVLFTAVYCTAMWFVARPLLARLLKERAERPGISQRVVVWSVVLLLLSSLATEAIGIHALFGAFFCGVIMPREGGLAHGLREKLEELVVVFLLPLFFAYSGLRTQIGLLDTPGAWALCGLFTLLAVIGKFGGATAAARITGQSWRDSISIGVLMNTRGLMELVVLNIGLDLGVISPTVFTMMVLMALVTTVMTSPLVIMLQRREGEALTVPAVDVKSP
jgi:Kef-type K+ transport system membrane component KefB